MPSISFQRFIQLGPSIQGVFLCPRAMKSLSSRPFGPATPTWVSRSVGWHPPDKRHSNANESNLICQLTNFNVNIIIRGWIKTHRIPKMSNIQHESHNRAPRLQTKLRSSCDACGQAKVRHVSPRRAEWLTNLKSPRSSVTVAALIVLAASPKAWVACMESLGKLGSLHDGGLPALHTSGRAPLYRRFR